MISEVYETQGGSYELGACILPVVVPVFRRRYPGIKVFIRENNSKELGNMKIAGTPNVQIYDILRVLLTKVRKATGAHDRCAFE